MDESTRDEPDNKISKKDVHANVGFFISSTPDETKLTQRGPKPVASKASLPFRIILVSDLAPGRNIDNWESADHLHHTNRNNFAELFKTLAPSLDIEIKDYVGDISEVVGYSLSLKSLEDFTPKGIVSLVPTLAGLRLIAETAAKVVTGTLSFDDLRSKIDQSSIDNNWSARLISALEQPAAPTKKVSNTPPATDNKSSLDHLFEMVNMGDSDEGDPGPPSESPADSPAALVDSFMAATAYPDSSPDTSILRQIIVDVEIHIARRVDKILQHDRVTQLEARWRGLKFLLDQLDFRSGVMLDVLAAGSEELIQAMHFQIVMAEHDNRSPLASLLVFDGEYGYSPGDVELLSRIASTAENIQTPAICSLSPIFWGNESAKDLATLPVIWQQLERPEYIEWVKFTETSAAGYVSLAYPPLILRASNDSLAQYGDSRSRENTPLFGAAAIATAAIFARRFSESGWPTFTGGSGDHALSDLLLWDGGGAPSPLAAIYREEKNGELADSGITVLTGLPRKDQIHLYASPTVSKRSTYDDDATTEKAHAHRNLEAQLFISRIVQFLITEQDAVSAHDDLATAREYLETRLISLLGLIDNPDAGNYAGVIAIEVNDGTPHAMLDVSVEAPPSILARSVGFRARIPFD